MYIKVKHIKQFILITFCIFFAGFNYLTYVNADNSQEEKDYICDKSVDSDCDGLINSEEKLYGTDAENADTDGDSYSDGIEIKSGYDPLKPAPGDKIETANSTSGDAEQATAKGSSASIYSQNLSAYIESKKGQPISVNDIKTFADEQIVENMGGPVTMETLPEIDKSQIKILEQNYANMGDKERKEKEKEDATKYLSEIAYLLASNAPAELLTKEDFSKFKENFFSHLSSISNLEESDLEYFSKLGDGLEMFLEQVNEVEVPETMVELHTKFLRIAKGILTLRDSSLNVNDSMDRVIVITKVNAYAEMSANFFKNDFANYFKNLE